MVRISVHDDFMYGAIKGMLEATEDPFTFMLDEKLTDSFTKEMAGKFGGLGISISKSNDGRILIVAPIEDTPAEKVGILPGDIISEIEGESTKGITTDEAVSKMRGKAGSKINITIVRAGVPEPIDYTLTRAVIEIKSVKYGMLEDGIGYVRVTTFGDDTSKDLRNALADLKKQGMKKIILELLTSSKTNSLSSMRLIALLGSVSIIISIIFMVFSMPKARRAR